MKKRILWALLDLVFLAVFNVIFFTLGGSEHPASVWLSYAFIHFAYVMLLATPIFTRKCSTSSIFGLSIYAISGVYFLVEFVVGIVFIILRQDTVNTALIVQVIIAGVYAVVLLIHLIANESTADSIEKQEREIAFVKESSAAVKLLEGKLNSKQANKKIEAAYDALHASPAQSSPEVGMIESSVWDAINELSAAVSSRDEEKAITAADRVVALVSERNIKLRQTN